MITRLTCIAIGYLFGLFQTSYVIGKRHGIDIRDHGSGNAGTTNMMRTLGTKAGLLTLLGDCLKCILAILFVRFLFKGYEIKPLVSIYAAAGVILGHNYPFYLNFRGGKGIAATAGLILSFHPIITICGIITFFGIFFTTHYVSLGSIMVYIGLFIETIILGQLGFFHMTQAHLLEMYFVIFLLMLLAIYKHKGNIERLLSGTERKTYLTKKSDK